VTAGGERETDLRGECWGLAVSARSPATQCPLATESADGIAPTMDNWTTLERRSSALATLGAVDAADAADAWRPGVAADLAAMAASTLEGQGSSLSAT